MGTADELALDVLLNTLLGFSADMVGLRSVRLGGQNEDWPLPEEDPEDDYLKVRGAGEGGGKGGGGRPHAVWRGRGRIGSTHCAD